MAGLPGVLARATAIKAAVDHEAPAGAWPSIALNRLVATADRMQVTGMGRLCMGEYSTFRIVIDGEEGLGVGEG